MAEYDSPWKELLDQHAPQALALLFPDVDEDVDWAADCESLEQELPKMAPEGPTGKRLADKLLKVRSRSGDERYLHVEVQGQPEADFERRMFVYHYRVDDRFALPPEALVILADDDPGWRPTAYVVRLRRTRLTFEFAPVKLLDWAGREQELQSHANPVALFVLAHLKSRQTRHDPAERARVKLDLIVRLHARKLEVEELRQWYRYLDWLLDLPREYEVRVWQEVKRTEEETKVPFVTFAERYGREQGERDGLRKGLEAALRIKFGTPALELMPSLRQVEDPATLEAILQTVEQAATLDDVRKLLPPAQAP